MNLQNSRLSFLLNNKFLISSKPFHLIILFFSYAIFWNYWIYFPLSDDGAFYGFMAKSLLGGSILHQDIPISTNSLNIYVLAFFMKLFGSSVVSFKIYHLIFSISLTCIIYLILRKNFLPIVALIASLVVGMFLHIPDIMLDLGRNPIMISLFLLFLGIYYYFCSKNKFRYLYFGALLGLSAIVRETFLFVALIIFLDLFINFYRGKCKSSDIKLFLFGFAITLSINALILSFYGIWAEYFHDMLFSGVNFRYSEGFLSFNRILGNINVLKYGYNNYYGFLVLLSSVSYIFKGDDKIFSYFKFVLVPAFLIEAIIINSTVTYSIQPLLILIVVLSFYTIKYIINAANILNISEKVKKINISKTSFFLLLYLFLFFQSNTINIVTNYLAYNKIALANKHNKLINANPNRILDIINRIDHKSISTHSQYPTLFSSKISYKTKWPFMEDLSSGNNTGNKKIWTDQLEKLNSTNPPNLYIDKTTTNSFISKETQFGNILDNNYIEIARFAKIDDGWKHTARENRRNARDRILLSKQYFNSSYKLISKSNISIDDVGSAFKYNNIYDEPVIIKIIPSVAGCEIGLSAQSAFSEIEFQKSLSSENYIYNFILPKNWTFIKNKKNENCNSFVVYEYKQK